MQKHPLKFESVVKISLKIWISLPKHHLEFKLFLITSWDFYITNWPLELISVNLAVIDKKKKKKSCDHHIISGTDMIFFLLIRV